MRTFSWLSPLFFLTAALTLAGAEAPGVNGLRQDALQSAFQVLRRDYIRRDELTMEELNRAALAGLLERLRYGARLVPTGRPPEKAQPSVHAEFLAPDIFYLRPETFADGEGALFEKALRDGLAHQAQHLILDLRGTAGEGLFEEAAVMLECFLPAGEVMFKLKQIGREDAELFVSRKEKLWAGSLLVLVDRDTNNAAEALAAALQQRGRAFLIGEKTRGAAVRYAEVQLDAAVSLRYASAEVLLPDGAPVFEHGLLPAFPITAVQEEKHQAFAGSRGKSMKPFVQDRPRPRYNERALVSDTNPELDDMVRRSQGQPLPGDGGQVRDVVTQAALALLQGRDFIAGCTLDWKAAAQGVEAPGDSADPGSPQTSTPHGAPPVK